MSSLSSTTGLCPAPAWVSYTPLERAASGASVARPVVAGQEAGAAPVTQQDAAVAAAREKLTAAVRCAFLLGVMRGTQAIAAEPAAASARDVFVGEILARLSVQAVRLPVLPEPATPARDAFAKAVFAMRSGLRRTADGALAGGA